MRPFALALPLMLLLPVGFADAQAGGSYRQSCRDIRQNGSILSARCRGTDGQFNDTSIDLNRCRGQGVANSFGLLTCGNVAGTSRSPGYGGGDFQGGGYGAPPPPPRRYYQQPDDDDQGYYPPPPRRPRYAPDQDY